MRKLIQLLVVTPMLLLLTAEPMFSQQDPQFTNYMYNTTVINPAYAGTRDALSVLALYRSQWVGLEGAPTKARPAPATMKSSSKPCRRSNWN